MVISLSSAHSKRELPTDLEPENWCVAIADSNVNAGFMYSSPKFNIEGFNTINTQQRRASFLLKPPQERHHLQVKITFV